MLFGVLPIYVALLAAVALRDEPLRPRLFLGVVLALAGLVVAFSERVALGESRHALVAAIACVVAPVGEPLTVAELGGAALVAAGIAVAQWPRGALVRRRDVTSQAPG
jgi:drug/metabolite transporter (DMT)-like permease